MTASTSPPQDSFAIATTKSALTVTVGGALGQLITVVAAVLVTRILGAHEFGVRAGCVAIIALASAAVQLSLGWIDIRRLAPAWQQRDLDQALEVASTTWALRMILSIGVGALVSLWLFAFSGLLESRLEAFAILVLTITQYWHQTNVSLLLPMGMSRSFMVLDLMQKTLVPAAVIGGFIDAQLTGAFVAHAGANVLLVCVSTVLLRRALPVGIRRFSAAIILRDFSHLGWNIVSLLCYSVQTYLPVYLVAAMVSPTDAAFANIQLQAFLTLNGLALVAQQAILPRIAGLESDGAHGRIHQWAGLVFQVAVGASCLLLVIWHLWGETLTVLLLSNEFRPAAPGVFWMIVAHMFFFGGHVCFGILNIRGHARESALTWAIYMIANVSLVLLAIRIRPELVATQIALAYASASALFFLSVFFILRWIEHRWLPIRAAAGLAILATVFVVVVPTDYENIWPRILASAVTIAVYLGLCAWLQLLPIREGRLLVAALRPKSVASLR